MGKEVNICQSCHAEIDLFLCGDLVICPYCDERGVNKMSMKKKVCSVCKSNKWRKYFPQGSDTCMRCSKRGIKIIIRPDEIRQRWGLEREEYRLARLY